MRNHSQDARKWHRHRYLYPYLAISVAIPAALLVSLVVHAEPVDLKAQMSATQYRAAGLDQLTPAQRASLNAWLAEHQAGLLGEQGADAVEAGSESGLKPKLAPPAGDVVTQAKPAKADRFGSEQIEKKAPPKPEIAEARIAGEFRGWDGKTLFRLDNGQIWQQRVGGRYRYRAVDPEVKIHRARFGYYLEIAATGRKVGIKRVK